MARLDALTFKQLRALAAVTEAGSITAAAQALSLTPPAVHSQLRALEENFGCALVHRDRPEGFAPTPEGEALLEAHGRATAALDRAAQRIDALRAGRAGLVVLGVVSTGKYFAPGLVRRLQGAFPDIEVVLRVGNRDQIIGMLDSGRLDLAIMGRPPRRPAVIAESVGDHPHVMIAPPGHPLAQGGPPDPRDILRERFVMRERGSGTRILAMRYLDEICGGEEFLFTEMESNETIKQAVIAGLGIGILSWHTVVEELRSGRLIAVPAAGMPILRRWFAVHPEDAPLSRPARVVMDWLVAERDGWLPRLDASPAAFPAPAPMG